MKNIALILAILFCSLYTNAQLSAENYCLNNNQSDQLIESNLSGFLSETSDLEGNDFNKKRRRPSRRTGPDNILKTNITNIIFYSPTISYERTLNSNFSFGGSVVFTSYDYSSSGIEFNGAKAFVDVKYYIMGDAPTKFYIGGFLFFSKYSLIKDGVNFYNVDTGETFDQFEADLTAYGAGGMIGYQIISDYGLVIDLNIGLGFGASDMFINIGDDDSFSDLGMLANITGRGGVSIGWGF